MVSAGSIALGSGSSKPAGLCLSNIHPPHAADCMQGGTRTAETSSAAHLSLDLHAGCRSAHPFCNKARFSLSPSAGLNKRRCNRSRVHVDRRLLDSQKFLGQGGLPTDLLRNTGRLRHAETRGRRTSMGSTRAAATGSKDDNILLVGATGGTGGSVLDGLLASGISSASLHVLSRNPNGKGAQALASRGVHVVSGDLDDEASVREAMKGMRAVYCHATSKDAAKADPIGDIRAEKLARAAKDAGIEHIVYNSSGGRGANTRISQVDQKHHIEDIFVGSGIPTTNLQAVLFMEEFWKVTTRPAIQKGTFPFSMPADKPLQLLAVKDMGRAAGTALLKPEEYAGKSLELAGDQLTPRQLCEEFSRAQGGSPVKQLSLPRFLFWFLNKDLFRIIKFLAETGYSADIDDCRARFPGMLTFREFLELTNWGDSERTYEGGFRY